MELNRNLQTPIPKKTERNNNTNTSVYLHINQYMYTYIYIYIYTYTGTHTHKKDNVYMCICMHNVREYTLARARTHTYTHTYIHTYIHVYIYIYTHMQQQYVLARDFVFCHSRGLSAGLEGRSWGPRVSGLGLSSRGFAGI